MDEDMIEQCRWRCQRILKADPGRVGEWQKTAALVFQGNSKPGKQPSDWVFDYFREAWRGYWTNDKNEDQEVFE